MSLSITLSDKAIKDIQNIEYYLDERFGNNVKVDFLAILTDRLYALAELPNMGNQSAAKKGLYRLLINKSAYIYYRFNSKELDVISIIDTRMDSSFF
jgi:plasmid stabilization system protein ParE